MKTLRWFTSTNIDTRFSGKRSLNDLFEDIPTVSFDLTDYINTFRLNRIWEKPKYRTEYNTDYGEKDLNLITSIKIHLHSKGAPYSNTHNYENVISRYIKLDKIERHKISSSNISTSSQIAVIELDFNSGNKIIDYLSYGEEKEIDKIFDKLLTSENLNSYHELRIIKSIACEFVQFFIFNLHLNFLTHGHEFSFTDKPNYVGFTTVSEGDSIYYSTDMINFFNHYIFFDFTTNKVNELMNATSKFWHLQNHSIHFFLDAIKDEYVTPTNFIKLLFTLESFFGKNISNDYITLTVPLILGTNIKKMKRIRVILKESFNQRNLIVHGNEVYDINKKVTIEGDSISIGNLFCELKNIIIHIFYFCIKEDLFTNKSNLKINHELIFKLLPQGVQKK